MSYYMRFFDTSEHPLSLSDIERAIQQTNRDYRLDTDGRLLLSQELYAQIEVNEPGDGLFEEEIQEMMEFLDDANGAGRERVLTVLKNARRTVCIQVLRGERETEPTLAAIDPVVRWLLSARDGLLQAAGEGYYDKDGLILQES